MPTILNFGRWLNDRSAREYLRKGEVSLLRQATEIPVSAWQLAAKFAAMGPKVWSMQAAHWSKDERRRLDALADVSAFID